MQSLLKVTFCLIPVNAIKCMYIKVKREAYANEIFNANNYNTSK